MAFSAILTTQTRTLEELRTIFDIPTRAHIKYRVTVVTRWLFKLTLLFVRNPKAASALLLDRSPRPASTSGPKREGKVKTILRKVVDKPLKKKAGSVGTEKKGEEVQKGGVVAGAEATDDGDEILDGMSLIQFHDWYKQQAK